MSNLIKSAHVVSLEDLKRLELISRIFPEQQNISGFDNTGEGNAEPDVETQSLRDRILQDAEQTAQTILQQAQQAARQIRADAEAEAEKWWETRREEDGRLREETRRQGFEEGYAAGAAEAEQEAVRQWESRLRDAQAVVEQAYITKNKVIAEAEAFLVELSCAIAEKIIGEKLAEAPEKAIAMFANALSRRKEQGVIVLCVSPSQFAFVQAAKDELLTSLDAQAELQIVPDSGVKEGGCIVRSAFGSIDARVDTQLESIREQLLRVAAHAAEEGSRDAAP